jgi:hypothetical protein
MAPPRTALEIAVEHARLCREIARLTEAYHIRLGAGDESGSEEFGERRLALLEALVGLERPVEVSPGDAEALRASRQESAEAIARTLALDREVTALLGDRLGALRTHLGALRQRRESLARYQGRGPFSASFADRIG